jgi:hypothetical protein
MDLVIALAVMSFMALLVMRECRLWALTKCFKCPLLSSTMFLVPLTAPKERLDLILNQDLPSNASAMILVTRIKKTLKMNLPTGENNNQSK